MQRKRDFSNLLINVYGDKNDYALWGLSRDGVDTVGVCGSNPHAPTNVFNTLVHTIWFSVAPKRFSFL
jgi:hypothetical protein